MFSQDTIVAPATATGRGSIGIVRVSGPEVKLVAQRILGRVPVPRYAHFCPFFNSQQGLIDEGIAIFFPAPHSFTGEDVLELQGHGGPIVMDLLIAEIVSVSSARMAKPGEFSERAFLNGKMDLLQAEAVADLIDARSQAAARAAVQTLKGAFSSEIKDLHESLLSLRRDIEADMDFGSELPEGFSMESVAEELDRIEIQCERILASAQTGVSLKEGSRIVLAGAPNTGKSSLMNLLCRQEKAIVTAIPGTTRDVLQEELQLKGLTFFLYDTAGLRDTEDPIEQAGIARAQTVIHEADHLLWLMDANQLPVEDYLAAIQASLVRLASQLRLPEHITVLRNKIDLLEEGPSVIHHDKLTVISLSVRTQAGLDVLETQVVARAAQQQQTAAEGRFLARRRHLTALQKVVEQVREAKQLVQAGMTEDLIAEVLRLAQEALSELTGKVTSEGLLDEIFSHFCLGK